MKRILSTVLVSALLGACERDDSQVARVHIGTAADSSVASAAPEARRSALTRSAQSTPTKEAVNETQENREVNAKSAAAPATVDDKPPLTGLGKGFESPEALSNAALDALSEGNAEALHALRVTEREYLELLWPEIEKTIPKSNLPGTFHWQMLDSKSAAGARDAIADYGRQELELLEVIPTRGRQDYGTFKLLRKVELRVRRQPDSVEGQIRVFGSVVELDGLYKILSFPS